MQTGKRIVAVILCLGLSVAMNPHSAWGHGGGLNSAGCHNDHSNGTYHCHRGGDSDDGDAWEAVLLVTGVLVGLGLVLWVLNRDQHASYLHEEIHTDEPRLAPFYDIEEDKFGLKFAAPF